MKKRIKVIKEVCPICKKKYIAQSFDQDMCEKCLINFANYLSPKKKKIINCYNN